MKTFQEFILEALLIENDQEEFAKIREEIRKLQTRRKPGDEEEALRLSIQAQKLARRIKLAAKGGAALQQMRDTPRKPSNPNSITGGGYAQTGRRGRIGPDPTSSVGTQSGVDRTGVHDLRQGGRRIGSATAPDEVVAGKYDKVTGGRGTRVNRSGGTVGRKG